MASQEQQSMTSHEVMEEIEKIAPYIQYWQKVKDIKIPILPEITDETLDQHEAALQATLSETISALDALRTVVKEAEEAGLERVASRLFDIAIDKKQTELTQVVEQAREQAVVEKVAIPLRKQILELTRKNLELEKAAQARVTEQLESEEVFEAAEPAEEESEPESPVAAEAAPAESAPVSAHPDTPEVSDASHAVTSTELAEADVLPMEHTTTESASDAEVVAESPLDQAKKMIKVVEESSLYGLYSVAVDELFILTESDDADPAIKAEVAALSQRLHSLAEKSNDPVIWEKIILISTDEKVIQEAIDKLLEIAKGDGPEATEAKEIIETFKLKTSTPPAENNTPQPSTAAESASTSAQPATEVKTVTQPDKDLPVSGETVFTMKNAGKVARVVLSTLAFGRTGSRRRSEQRAAEAAKQAASTTSTPEATSSPAVSTTAAAENRTSDTSSAPAPQPESTAAASAAPTTEPAPTVEATSSPTNATVETTVSASSAPEDADKAQREFDVMKLAEQLNPAWTKEDILKEEVATDRTVSFLRKFLASNGKMVVEDEPETVKAVLHLMMVNPAKTEELELKTLINFIIAAK